MAKVGCISLGFVMRRLAAFFLLLALSAALPAAEFQVNPVRVELEGHRRADTLLVSNRAAEPLRFEVTVNEWRMAADGAWQLVPSDELIVHPLLLEVPAGGAARLRVGTLEPIVDGPERAFRIEMLEQASPGSARPNALRMVAKVSLPVFVRAGAAKAVPQVRAPAIRRGALEFGLHNAGDSYLAPQKLALELRSARGDVLHRQELGSNYVLAGATFPVRARVPADACGRVAAIRVVFLDSHGALDSTLPADARHCAP
jgi:P pilus assembly chaperone PapD